MDKLSKDIEKLITIVIPSREFDSNLKFCLKKIRFFYKNIKILIVLDAFKKKILEKDKNINLIISKTTIGAKRNIASKKVKTKFICFIDSDAYPNTAWLDRVKENLFAKNFAILGGPNLSPSSKNFEKILISRVRKLPFVTINPKVKTKTNLKEINFLPSSNLVVNTNIYKKLGGMYEYLYSGEEIKLNYNIQKKNYIILFDAKMHIMHKERKLQSFMKQRFVYGSTALRLFIKFPCKASFKLLLSSVPSLWLIFFPIIFVNNFFLITYLFISVSVFILVFYYTYKIYLKNNFLKSFKIILISIFAPGIGMLASFFLKDNIIQKLYTQK